MRQRKQSERQPRASVSLNFYTKIFVVVIFMALLAGHVSSIILMRVVTPRWAHPLHHKVPTHTFTNNTNPTDHNNQHTHTSVPQTHPLTLPPTTPTPPSNPHPPQFHKLTHSHFPNPLSIQYPPGTLLVHDSPCYHQFAHSH